MAKKASVPTLKKLVLILPNNPSKIRFFLKLGLGIVFLFLFLPYQPSLKTPPFKRNIVLAESVQQPLIAAKSLNFTFQLPHPGYLSTPFSDFHPGIDVATGLGMPIHPIAPGKIISTGYDFWGLGLNVVVEHDDGYQSTYAHLGKIYVNVDQTVSESSILGEVGLTGHTSGPHTHLEVMKDGTRIDPRFILPTIRTQPMEADFVATGSAALALQSTIIPKNKIAKPDNSPKPVVATPLAESSLNDKISQVSDSATKPATSLLNNLSIKP